MEGSPKLTMLGHQRCHEQLKVPFSAVYVRQKASGCLPLVLLMLDTD